MTTPWRKAIQDFRLERTRTALVVMAIAVGITGFSAVLASYAILTRELNRGYLATNPASATLFTDPIDDALIDAVAASPGINAAEGRRVVTGRLKVGPAEWRGLVLFVVRDYGKIRVSRLDPQQGAWPPGPGELLIERDAMQVARTQIGGSVRVKTLIGKEQSLRVTGTVHDVGQAQARMENIVYGYITLDTLQQLGETPYLDQLKIIVAEHPMDEPHIRSVAADVGKLITGLGHRVRRTDVPPPGKHPHADIMGLLLLAMSSFGFCVLALSGILVVNLLTALMASEVRQIGMMKAIGGRREQIAGIYFAQALFLGMAAVVVALPFGILGSRQLCSYLAVFLNFDITSFAIPAWVFLLVAAVGIVVPLLAAAYPVWKGTGVSVREALADNGVGQTAFGVSAVDRAVAGISGGSRPLLLALRNSFRRRTRLALTVATLSAGGLFFLSALNVRSSMINTLDHIFGVRKYDLSVGLGLMYPYEKVERAIRDTPGVIAAEGWIAAEGSIPGKGDSAPAPGPQMHSMAGAGAAHGGGGPVANRFGVTALPPGTKLLALDMAEGRALSGGDGQAVVLNTALAAKMPQVKVGDKIALRIGPSQLEWQVVGISREPFLPATAYIPKPTLEKLGGHTGMANQLRLALDHADPASISRVKAALDANLERDGVRAMASSSKADGRYGFDQHMLMIYVFLIVASAIIAAVGTLGLATTMSLNVLERRREMGVLRAIGASPMVVWRIVVSEGVAIGLMSWTLAAALAWPVSSALANMLAQFAFQSALNFRFELSGLAIWLAVSIGVSAAASLLPAWKASRVTVREALANV